MRKGVLLLLFAIISSTFSLTISELNCTDGIVILNGSFYSEDAYYVDGRTFVKCGNQAIFSDIYGPISNNYSIFDGFGTNLTFHKTYLFVYLDHSGNFSISNYTFEFNGTHIFIENDSIEFSGLLEIEFSNSTFSLLNRTFTTTNDTINVTDFLSFTFNKISNYTLNSTVFYDPLVGIENESGVVMITYPPDVNNPEKIFFIISELELNVTPLYDDYTCGISFSDCGLNLTEVDTKDYLIPNQSHVIKVSPIDFTNYTFVFDDKYCDANGCPTYRWYQEINVVNPFENLSYEVINDTLWIMNPGLDDLSKLIFDEFIFDLSGMKEKYRVQLNSENPMIMCRDGTCLKDNVTINSTFKFNSTLPDYIFMNSNFSFNLTQVIFSKYFELSFIPRFNVSSPDCPDLNFTLNGTEVSIHSNRNQITCGICINYSYLNQSGQTCKDIEIDEPFINVTSNGTVYNYTITSKSVPTIWVYKDGNLIFTKTGKTGEFQAEGNITVIYGNIAGNKTYKIISNPVQGVNNTQSNTTQGSTNTTQGGTSSGSASSSGFSSGSYSGSSSGIDGSQNATVNETDIKLSNVSINSTELSPVVFEITGKYLDVNNSAIPIYGIYSFIFPIIIFLILKYFTKTERRIIE